MLFNDLLGTTLGSADNGGKAFDAIQRTAFGEMQNDKDSYDDFFTGKPYVGELGYAFMFRNYRADKGKWSTADPLGYPDGFNNLAYVNNGVINSFDIFGLETWTYDDVNYSSSNWSRLVGIGYGGQVSSGIIRGDNAHMVWRAKIDWSCKCCNKSGSEYVYTLTIKYVPGGLVWSIPTGSVLSVGSYLGVFKLIGQFFADTLADAVASGTAFILPKEFVAQYVTPSHAAKQNIHSCEPSKE